MLLLDEPRQYMMAAVLMTNSVIELILAYELWA